VTPETGVVRCEKCTIAVDPGVIINPQQLKRQIEGGAVMGVSHALLEELAFDQSGVTQDDWISYPILTMADIPEIEVVLINNPSTGTYGAGSEAANALAVPAIVAALHDATGKQIRRIPLKPAYVQELMKG
jgi:CO/xanthine dehydrogenase Mo-binding subunit